MKRNFISLGIFMLIVACSPSSNAENQDSAQSSESAATVDTEMTTTAESAEPQSKNSVSSKKVGNDPASRLLAAYPEKISEIKDNYIYFKDGTKMIFDDGKQKSFEQMLDNSDPQDMFFKPYDTTSAKPEYLSDCGRSRSEELFKKLYGKTQGEVSKQMISVEWFGGNVRFSKSNGAAKQLAKVKAELARYPELRKYLTGASTFYWRKVRGANRLSAHSYGMAIDINTANSDYWLWKNPKAGELGKFGYQNRIPMKIVEIFEKYGFIWGGRWYHYDTMHFEYRPELNPPRL